MITVSTDGSCLRNPGGPTGWAWINHDGTHGSGGDPVGTNQIGELMALLQGVLAHPGAEPLTIETDSQYAIRCASVWVAGWRRKGWRTASGGPVQNLALVQAIERALADRPGAVTFEWVRGHRGNHFNERADELAGAAAREAQRTGTPHGILISSIAAPTPAAPTPQPTPPPAPDLLF